MEEKKNGMSSWTISATNSGQIRFAKWKPPIVTQHFLDHSPESFRKYVEGLYEERSLKSQKKKKPKKPYSLRRNTKGTLIIAVRRKPKWLATDEILALSLEGTATIKEIENYCKEKDIEIKGNTDETGPMDQLILPLGG